MRSIGGKLKNTFCAAIKSAAKPFCRVVERAKNAKLFCMFFAVGNQISCRLKSSRKLCGLFATFLILSVLAIVGAVWAEEANYGIDSSNKENVYAAHDIRYYDGNGSGNCSSGGCYIAVPQGASEDEEKTARLWTGLFNMGFTAEQTAGIVANIEHEGGTPIRQEDWYNTARDRDCKTQEGNPYTIYTGYDEHHDSCMAAIAINSDGEVVYDVGDSVVGVGLGFMGYSDPAVREPYVEEFKKMGLLKYLEGDAYKTWGRINTDVELKEKIQEETGSTADYDRMWCIALQFIYDTFTSDTYADFKDVKTADEAGKYISDRYERCDGCFVGQSQWTKRGKRAQEIFDDYKQGKFGNLTSSPASVANENNKNSEDNNGNNGGNNTGGDNKNENNSGDDKNGNNSGGDDKEGGDTPTNEDGVSPITTPSAFSRGQNTLIVGDSITSDRDTRGLILDESRLPEALIIAQYSKHIKMEGGSDTGGKSGLTIINEIKDKTIKEDDAHKTINYDDIQIVVFVLGTNDPNQINEEMIDLIVSTIGEGKTIYMATNYSAYENHQHEYYDSNNVGLRNGESRYNNLHIMDWATEIAQKEIELGEELIDRAADMAVHPIGEGKTVWADMISNAVKNGITGVENCKVNYNSDDAIAYLHQFIKDTNALYGQSYPLPPEAGMPGDVFNTPLDDSPNITGRAAVWNQWKTQGVVNDKPMPTACWTATWCGQCTALSGWFVTMMTDFKANSGDGSTVVPKLLEANPNLTSTTDISKVNIAIFSESNGDSQAGHTGVILGKFGEDSQYPGEYLTIENNYGGDHKLFISHRTFSQGTAYVDLTQHVHTNHLGTDYGDLPNN